MASTEGLGLNHDTVENILWKDQARYNTGLWSFYKAINATTWDPLTQPHLTLNILQKSTSKSQEHISLETWCSVFFEQYIQMLKWVQGKLVRCCMYNGVGTRGRKYLLTKEGPGFEGKYDTYHCTLDKWMSLPESQFSCPRDGIRNTNNVLLFSRLDSNICIRYMCHGISHKNVWSLTLTMFTFIIF